MKTPIPLRPHHVMCSLGFKGNGYSDKFVSNMWNIVNTLRNDNSTKIEIVAGLDEICAPCPNNLGKKCKTQKSIEFLDAKHMEALELNIGDTLTWHQAKERIKSSMTLEKFQKTCATCSWQKEGICEAALKKLRQEKSPSHEDGLLKKIIIQA